MEQKATLGQTKHCCGGSLRWYA